MSPLPQACLDAVCTVLVECGVAACILSRPRLPRLVDITWVNLLTNPLAHLALYLGAGFWPIEAGVILSESVLFRILITSSGGEAGRLSAVLNGTTIVLSLLVG